MFVSLGAYKEAVCNFTTGGFFIKALVNNKKYNAKTPHYWGVFI